MEDKNSACVDDDRQECCDQQIGNETIEMVATPRPPSPSPSRDSTTKGPENNNNGTIQHGKRQIPRNHPQSQLSSSTTNEGSPRNPSVVSTRENRSRDDDTNTGDTDDENSNDETDGDVAWIIISFVLKGWFVLWLLFAILVISAEMNSPERSRKEAHGAKIIVSAEDGQSFLETSERIVSACSYSRLDTEYGRGECQSLCRNHMCCLIDDGDGDGDGGAGSPSYGCVDDPEKMCAAYAGCESLVLSEEDAVIFDADGVAVFGVAGDSRDDTIDTTTTNTSSLSLEQFQSPGESRATIISAANFTSSTSLSSELEMIRRVVASVCSDDNLHARHGIAECASLCNASMCCFDRDEIEVLNPKMDLILKLEGVGDGILDRSKMGTCVHEEEGGDGTRPDRFCRVRAGCENLLLFGAPPTGAQGWRRPPSADPLLFAGLVVDADRSVLSEQQRVLTTVCVLFGLMIGITTYLLVCNRPPPVVIRLANNSNEDFVPVAEMVDFV